MRYVFFPRTFLPELLLLEQPVAQSTVSKGLGDREWCIGRNVNGNGRDIFKGKISVFTGGTEENHGQPETGLSVFQPTFEQDTCRIQPRCFTTKGSAWTVGHESCMTFRGLIIQRIHRRTPRYYKP